MSKKIFLVAAEASGDLHASRLAHEIKRIAPDVSLLGIGGAKMESEGVRIFRRTDELAIIGLFDIFAHLKRIREIFFSFLAKVKEEGADLVILVDYPGFNLRLARELKKRKVKVIYYISPQVWAWGRHRIKRIKQFVDKIIVLFEFEADIYRKAGVPVEFVGHPLLDTARPSEDKETIQSRLSLDAAKKTIILLPGSREREIEALLPVMLKASEKLYERHQQLQFIIVRSHNLNEVLFEKYLERFAPPYRTVVNRGSELYDYLSVSDMAIAASGTVTLQCAIMELPMIITYRVSLLNAILMKLFMRISLVGLVNILAGKEIVPELIQFDFTPGKVFRKAEKILFEPDRYERIKKELTKVKHSLGEEGASLRAAHSVLNSLQEQPLSMKRETPASAELQNR